MKNLSSLSKIQYANIASLVVFLITITIDIISNGFELLRILNILNFLLAWFMFLYIRKVQATIQSYSSILETAKKGILTTRVVNSSENGELKNLSSNINNLLDQFEVFTKEVGGTFKATSDGRYHRVIMLDGLHGDYLSSAKNVNTAIQQMQMSIENISKQALNADIESISKASAGFEIIQRNLMTAIDSLLHISENSNLISQSASSSQGDLKLTINDIDKIVELITQTNDRIEELTNNMHEITSVVNLINDIADQTNLLALNAAIEAARAGEHGRGFAVVAEEVRKLAENTQKATHTISISIKTLQQGTSEIDSSSKEMTDLASELSSSIGDFSNTLRGFTDNAKTSSDDTQMMKNTIFTILAKIDHVIFKTNAYNSITSGVLQQEFGTHNNCRLGKWYDGLGKEDLGNTPSYQKLIPHHKIVHDMAIKNMQYIMEKDTVKENKDRIISNFENMEEASEELFTILENIIIESKEIVYNHK